MNNAKLGELFANAGCWAAIGASYITWGTGAALFAAAIYLFVIGIGYQASEEEE